MNEEYVDIENDKTWRVLRYFGNDLAFRQEYFAHKNGHKAILIWATTPLGQQTRIDLSYIYDIVRKLERIIDLSLKNVLQEIIPRVTWPEALFENPKEIGRNLKTFHHLFLALRKELPHNVPLNENHVNAILIALNNPNVQISDLVFTSMPMEEGIIKYCEIVLTNELDNRDRLILKEIIEKNVVGDPTEISPWFNLKRDDLATLFYLLDVTSRYNIPNPFVQLRGLGLISFEIDSFDKKLIKKIAKNIKSNFDTKSQVKKIAEATLSLQEASKLIQCAKLQKSKEITNAFQRERNPLIAYTLAFTFLQEITKNKELKHADFRWAEGIAKQKTIVKETETEFSEKANDIIQFIANIGAVLSALKTPFEKKIDLNTLVDSWSETGFYKIQLVLTDAANYCQLNCEDDDLKRIMKNHIQSLKQKISDKIEQVDQNIALIIEKNWNGYLSHPRLSTNILKEYILQRGVKSSENRKIWILIFDGMRLDTWKQIVKPILQTKFEIKEEKLYVCTLPSKTDIARVAVLAGKTPNEWEDYYGGYTSNHNILSSKFFGLSRYEGREKLKVTVNAGTDFSRKRLDETTSIYNILIYNLSDKWIHNFQGDLRELNKIIEGTINRVIIPDLENRIGEKDIIVLTSDHGFIELAQKDAQNVFTPRSKSFEYGRPLKQGISYRVLVNIEHPKGLRIQYLPHMFYTAAIGRKWFNRPGGRFSRYTHGGITLDEMVVPGVLMEKIVFQRLDLIIECPDSVELAEDISSIFEVKITNNGNRTTDFNVSFRINTGESDEHLGSIQPRESQKVTFEFKKPTLLMKNFEIILSYRTLSKKPLKPKKRVIPIKVKARKDKVEFAFGGLDKIME